MIYILFISISVPLLLMALLMEKKARLPIVFMIIGIFVSVFASEVNGLFSKLLSMGVYNQTVIVTPVTEELLKALPIYANACLRRQWRSASVSPCLKMRIFF